MEFLIIGASATGKTHYGGQLYGRLSKRNNKLKLRGSPPNISPFEDVLEKLSEGKTASHTEVPYTEISLPLKDDNEREVDLIWADYTGEQINRIIEDRQIPVEWIQRLKKSKGWILFIRLSQIEKREDILSKPPGTLLKEINDKTHTLSSKKDTTVITYVELLQALIRATGQTTVKRINKLSLTIFLSCWDELINTNEISDRELPLEVLKNKMPIFHQFVIANWDESKLKVYGLSSLGKELNSNSIDEGYVDKGPENFGYIVDDLGNRNQDLTIPIFDLIHNFHEGNNWI